MALSGGAVMIGGCSAPAAERRASRSPATIAATQPTPSQTTRLTINDPCPSLLHDLCGPLLSYLNWNYRLPEHLDELRQMPLGSRIGELTCPSSKRPYVYNRSGVIGANVSQRAVIYDAVPHAGYRWVIVVKEATPNTAFVVEVKEWPESRFPKGTPPDAE